MAIKYISEKLIFEGLGYTIKFFFKDQSVTQIMLSSSLLVNQVSMELPCFLINWITERQNLPTDTHKLEGITYKWRRYVYRKARKIFKGS